MDRLTDILDRILRHSEGEDEVSLGELLGSLDTRAYGPFLVLPALLAVSPVGGIPGMSIVLGSLIVLIAGQALLGRSRPWLPERLTSFTFGRDRLAASADTVRPWLRRVDRLTYCRWTVLVQPPWFQVVAGVCVVLAASFVPLAAIPMAVSLPGTSVLFLAVGLTTRDGVVVAVGLALAVGAVALSVYAWPF
ncbi:MAG: exopolysaccharide biosynthesis protein [Sandaracinaceae bacterium]